MFDGPFGRWFAAFSGLACVLSLELASGGRAAAFVAGAEPFAITLALSIGLAATCFAFGLATGDCSWVDRLGPSSPSPEAATQYPAYADYRASTSAVVPWFPKRRLDHGTRQGA